MKVIGIEVETEAKNSSAAWRLYPIGDPHLDTEACDENRLKRYLQLIADDPCSAWILVGDVIDGTTPAHKFFESGALKADVLKNMDRYVDFMLEYSTEVFGVLKDRPGVVIEGNHDIRGSNRWSGFAGMLARKLGANYGSAEALIQVRAQSLGNNDSARLWNIYAAHGDGGGMFPGGKVNRHQNTVVHIADADIYVRGHVHDSDVRIIPRYGLTQRGIPRLRKRPVAYVTAGGFNTERLLDVEGYVARKSLPPTDDGLIYLQIENPKGGEGGHDGRMYRIEAQF